MKVLISTALVFVLSSIMFLTTAEATFLPYDQIPADTSVKAQSDMSEAQFKEVIESIRKIYTPIVASLGGKFVLSGDWRNEKLNAGSTQMFGQWKVQITGGLARRPELSADGFTLILCHELGHHLGGFSFAQAQLPFLGVWAANEGQADYFSTQVCARKLWVSETEKNATFKNSVTKFAQEKCDTAWNNSADRNLCYRVLVAVESMTQTMAAILKQTPPQFQTPDPVAVDKTSDKHPAIQCRMDTTFQGAICPAFFDEKMIPGKKVSGGEFSENAEKQAAANSCMAYSGYSDGLRPRCWFKPAL